MDKTLKPDCNALPDWLSPAENGRMMMEDTGHVTGPGNTRDYNLGRITPDEADAVRAFMTQLRLPFRIQRLDEKKTHVLIPGEGWAKERLERVLRQEQPDSRPLQSEMPHTARLQRTARSFARG
jgi:hypothetical protein